jgi:hypothetical protein
LAVGKIVKAIVYFSVGVDRGEELIEIFLVSTVSGIVALSYTVFI